MGSVPMRRRQFIVRFAMTGFGFAWLVFALAYLKNLAGQSLGSTADGLLQLTFLVLCPPSFALMATERATGFMLFLILCEIAIRN